MLKINSGIFDRMLPIRSHAFVPRWPQVELKKPRFKYQRWTAGPQFYQNETTRKA